ncbi:MAG TPA: TonB-dependent receptor, partial [Candidatus Cybelea sp.]
MKRPLRHLAIATIVLGIFVCQETRVLAGVTGGLSGTVVSADTSAPLAGAQVIASSPSQVARTTTDAAGHFTFLTLAPDTYTVSASKTGYQAVTTPGEVVFADTVQTVTIRLAKALQTIAHVSAAAAGALVKSGTTADVYSINSTTQKAVAALGGGNSLNSAYSAIASVPGAYVVPNQMGYFQTVMIRGGDYDQVGYEFDGVPINRSFDNYPSSSASSLGNAEVQVYTGAPPPNSESEGLSGYINQVIKTGSYPGYGTASLGIGTPTFYHRASVEMGGATPDRDFSYYLGIAGFNQDFRQLDNSNGASYANFVGTPMSFTGNGSYAPDPNGFFSGGCPGDALANTCQYYLGGINWASAAWNAIRNVVANVHIGIPHRYDAGRDDVQLLWDSEMALTGFYNTTNDIVSTQGCAGPTAASGAACAKAIGLGVPVYIGGVTWGCPSLVGQTYTQAALLRQASCVKPYSFPSSGVAPFSTIPYSVSDTMRNNQAIAKVQYTKNFGTTAFLRVYGYTYYSDWLYNAPQSLYADFAACCPPNYELSSHTRGVSANFQDQINPQNLLGVQASYVTASSIRDNNQFYAVGGETAAPIVSAAHPYSGACYGTAPNGSFGPVACSQQWTGSAGNYGGLTFPQIQSSSATAFPNLAGLSCAGSPCEYLVAENGLKATFNSVTPRFFAASVTDQFRPSDKWLFNVGGRLDSFTYLGANTDTGPARNFWTNAFNTDNCINALTGAPVNKTQPVSQGGLGMSSPLATCPSGYT